MARLLLLAALVVVPAPARAQTPSLSGIVTDTTGRPIQNAKVVVLGANDTVLTDRDGRYLFAELPEGVFTVRAMFIGFLRGERDSVRVAKGSSVRVDFRLRQPNCDIDCNPVVVPVPTKKPD